MRLFTRTKTFTTFKFQSTHPMRDATKTALDCDIRFWISIHASHAGCDLCRNCHRLYDQDFNPRIPCGMRPYVESVKVNDCEFQSTHPMRDATCDLLLLLSDFTFQSTHPMRDATNARAQWAFNALISIHASHAGCDTLLVMSVKNNMAFQSTHPMRDAT